MNINKIDNTDFTSEVTNLSNNNKSSNFSDYLNTASTYSNIFEEASVKYNVPVNLLEAVAMTESSFNPDCISNAGAMGLMQLMPSTADYLGVANAFDPFENIMGGAKYLSELLKKYNGDTDLALAAYNGGMGNVAKYDGIPPFCQKYVDKVNSYMEQSSDLPDNDDISDSKILSSEEFANMVYELFACESSKTTISQMDLFKSLLSDSDEYTKAISLLENIYNDENDN